MKRKLVKEKFTEIDICDILYYKRVKETIKVLTDVEKKAISAGYKFIETDFYGNTLGNKLDIIGAREENDEEYNKRIEIQNKKQIEKQKRAAAQKAEKEKQERKLLEQLKEKYGEK